LVIGERDYTPGERPQGRPSGVASPDRADAHGFQQSLFEGMEQGYLPASSIPLALPPLPLPAPPAPAPEISDAEREGQLVNEFFRKKYRGSMDRASRKAEVRPALKALVTQEAERTDRSRFPGLPPAKDLVALTLKRLDREPEADQVRNILGHFPLYGEGEALEVQMAELPEPASLKVNLDDVLESLERLQLVQANQGISPHESTWVLTQLGQATLAAHLRNSSHPETVAYLLDAQLSTLAARLYEHGDPQTVEPFLAAARDLLLDAMDSRTDGDPVRWGAAVRAVRNAVVVDMDRPGSLRPDGGGLSSQALAGLIRLSDATEFGQAWQESEFAPLVAALRCRESVRSMVRAGEPLEGLLLEPSTYQGLAENMLGLRAVAHAAWVHVCREAEDTDHQMAIAIDLARAVTGVPRGEAFRASDFALLTPDHREHLLLAVLYQDGDSSDQVRIESTPAEALHRLASTVAALEREYPVLETRIAAGIRILQLHSCFEGEEDAYLETQVHQVFRQMAFARGYAGEIMTLAQQVMGQPSNDHALADLIRFQFMAGDSPEEDPDGVLRVQEAGEWVAVAERFSEFGSMAEANIYRYAIMELLRRDEAVQNAHARGEEASPEDLLPAAAQAALGRMLRHSTSLMAILAQQDQVLFVPEAELAILQSYTHRDLITLVEGGGGRFGVARIPWLESEQESHWQAMVSYLGLKVEFPEDLDRLNSALLEILGCYTAPPESFPARPEFREEALTETAAVTGIPLSDLALVNPVEASSLLTLVQSVSAVKREGILCTFDGDGVSVEDAIRAHRAVQEQRKKERKNALPRFHSPAI
jgi:hypothetical protein